MISQHHRRTCCWAIVVLIAAAAMKTSTTTTHAFAPKSISNKDSKIKTLSFSPSASSTLSGSSTSTSLSMSLKPAAIPLMDSGKALARSGELLIDLTSDMELYGGALSATGALIRNSGDCIAQAAALCRFKTGAELACDELREAATCLTESVDKLQLATEEAKTDEDKDLAQKIGEMVTTMTTAGQTLEQAGAGIMMRVPLADVGAGMVACGQQLELLSVQIGGLRPGASNAEVASQRMAYASEKMIEAGNELQGTPKPKPKGKGWLKG